MALNTGIFISFEGPDGSGKSSLAKQFNTYLESKGFTTLLTREPGGNQSEVAEAIRHLVLECKNYNIADKTEALLFAASRAQHTCETILPALQAHKVVVCDRFIDSSLAYQGYGRKIGFDEVYQINKFATDGLLPDVTFFIDIPVSKGLERIRKDQRHADRLDEIPLATHEQAYAGYQALIKK